MFRTFVQPLSKHVKNVQQKNGGFKFFPNQKKNNRYQLEELVEPFSDNTENNHDRGIFLS